MGPLFLSIVGKMSHIADNFETIRRKINKAERTAGRAEGSVTLVAVTKTLPEHALLDALEAGQRVFGENKVQEAQGHWTHLRPSYPDLKLHLIGPLQTNKAADAVALFDVIETLDREKLALALKDEMQKQDKTLPCLIQVNTGEEEQKSGVNPKDLKAFHAFCVGDCGLTVTGLMCIPPVNEPAGLHFTLLKKYARELNLSHLSMGMSADFEKAIAAGATHVRVGTSLFGPRLSQ